MVNKRVRRAISPKVKAGIKEQDFENVRKELVMERALKRSIGTQKIGWNQLNQKQETIISDKKQVVYANLLGKNQGLPFSARQF